MKKIGSLLFHRVVLAALIILLQLAILVVVTVKFGEYFVAFYWCAVVLSVAAVLWVVSSNSNGGFKIAWIVLILVFPVMGGLLYLMFGGGRLRGWLRRRLAGMRESMSETLRQDCKAEAVAEESGVTAGNQARYLERYAHCPAYDGTKTEYYALGDDCFQPMLEALEKAERYIFLEYFIIDRGEFWDSILECLKRKAAQGLEVRVIYDDIGSMYTLPSKYPAELAQYGIRCVSFNRFVPVLSTLMNNRDHRKICVVDGTVAFTGGINLADEYVNRCVKYGHWKDCAIRLEGPAAWSMAVMFLTMWNFATEETTPPEAFRPFETPRFPGNGWVQPYTDCPWDGEPVGETVYLNLISKAKRYVYICTPYLILDETMTNALVAAAKAGVDVRIMTPHVPDKRIVFQMTRAHYEPLLRGGVRIYEYVPGFVHGKSFVVDDRFGTVGSVNLDYRSLFLHFENGVLLTDNPAVREIKADFLSTLERCRPYTLADCRAVRLPTRFCRSLLRVFAPLF